MMNKSFIVKDLYDVCSWDTSTYVDYKNEMCNTLLWKCYSFTWKTKYLHNLILYKTLGV